MSRSHLWRAILVLIIGPGPALVPGAETAKSEVVIRMPPFVVEVEAVDSLHWFYAEGRGLQILSAGEEEQTQEFIQDLTEHRADLAQFLPEEFLLDTTIPTTVILFPQSLADRMDKEMVQELSALSSSPTRLDRFEPMNDLRLSDPDSTYIFLLLRDQQWMRARMRGQREPQIVESPDYVRFLVGSRVPALPAWYVEGISGLYRTALLTNRPPSFMPDPWLSEDAARALRGDPSASRPLLPLHELFLPAGPRGKSEKYRQVWAAQAELFVRWVYSGNVDGGRERLRRFTAAAATEPVTPELFRSCFGLNYADARDALSDYLPEAVRTRLQLPRSSVTPPPIALRDAHPEEIRRIKGEWGRRTLRVIRENYPAALLVYIEKTRKLLQRAYDRGDRDPQLLASLALFRMDTGDKKGGREILAAHPDAASVRPLAGLILAQSSLLDALGQPAGRHGNLSEEQAAAILHALAGPLRQPSPIEAAYVLAATVLQHLDRAPSDEERVQLDQGARLFPRNPVLPLLAAAWDLRAGDIPKARTLIDWALWESSDSAVRGKLTLLSELAAQASATSSAQPHPGNADESPPPSHP